MDKSAQAFLQELLATPTPSGYEQEGQKKVAKYMKRFADNVKTDVHGNVHGVLNPKGKIRVMLAGHCDEIGLMIMHIDDKGYLSFSNVGGVNVPLLPGERVKIHTKKGVVPGVIGVKAIHLMTAKERQEAKTKIHELWIDIGAKNKKEAEKIVDLGDVATIDAGYTELYNGLVACRGFDDRIGAFVVAETLRLLKGKKIQAAVHAVSTTQEEIGLRGARTAAFGVDPHVGIAVDVGFATDYPSVNPKQVGEAACGDGPILHRGPNFHPAVVEGMQKAARSARVKTQMQPIPGGSPTDANVIQMSRAGVAAELVSIPTRYLHSPVEVLAIKDAENAAKMIAKYIESLKGSDRFGE